MVIYTAMQAKRRQAQRGGCVREERSSAQRAMREKATPHAKATPPAPRSKRLYKERRYDVLQDMVIAAAAMSPLRARCFQRYSKSSAMRRLIFAPPRDDNTTHLSHQTESQTTCR